MTDRSPTEKAPVEKPSEKADRPSETASIPPVRAGGNARQPPTR